MTRSATFDAVLKWKADLDQKVSLPDGGQIPCILLANKVSDLEVYIKVVFHLSMLLSNVLVRSTKTRTRHDASKDGRIL